MSDSTNVTSIVIPSAHRTMLGAKPENRLRVFELQARELLRYVRNGQADHAEVIDALQAMAHESGLVEFHGQDEIQALMADAVADVGRPNAPDEPITSATPSPEKPKGFSFVTYEEARSGSPAQRWLLKSLLAYNERSAWVGAPGSLKSAILTSLAYAVASGRSFCGKRNKGACAVIYFALERADLVKRRLHACAEREGGADLPIAVVGNTINFMDEKVVGEVVATIDLVQERFGVNVGLIIIDTFAKAIAAGGGDEDKAKDQGMVFANLQRVTEQRSVHFALVCHTGKDEHKGIRGSSAAGADFGIIIQISGTDTRSAMITKNNDGAEGFLSSFKPLVHDFGKDEDGDPVEVCLAEPVEGDRTDTQTSQKISSKQRLALDALAECAATPLPSALGLSPVLMGATVDQWRAEMMRRSIIDKGARNPRADFKRLKEQMQVNNLIGIYDDLVWRAIP